MITPAEERRILSQAYVPEHLPGYVTAVSGAEPFLLDDYLCFRVEDSLLFNGYPLGTPSRNRPWNGRSSWRSPASGPGT